MEKAHGKGREVTATESPVSMREIDRELSRRHLLDFTQYTFPEYQANDHHIVLSDLLDRFVDDGIDRLMVSMPPRHGKSEKVSRRLPAFIFGRFPDSQIIATSYSADLAGAMNRDVQRIIDSPEYRELFPNTRLYGKNVKTVAGGTWLRNSEIFEIVDHKGIYKCAGVGGPITGRGANYIIIDDPIKNKEEADSEAYRRKLWEWYRSTLRTRAEEGCRILITMTRWHEDDLAGRLLDLADEDDEADQWMVVNFPAVAGEIQSTYDRRKKGQALWADKYPLEELKRIEATVGPRIWGALYQGKPSPEEGGLFDKSDFAVVDAISTDVVGRVRYWDLAATEDGGDFTVGARQARTRASGYFVEDVVRGQWDSFKVEKMILNTASQDGKNVDICIEQEPGAAGKTVARHFVRLLAGYNVEVYPARQDKITRARPFSAQVKAGNVKLLRGAWNRAFLDELDLFPYGKNDDQVDGVSGGFNHLTEVDDVIGRLKALTS